MLPPLLLAFALVPPDGDLDDRTLARRIREGDRQAFRQFFDRYHGLLYRYLLRRKVDGAVAEDLIQNAFLYLWEHRRDIDPERSLRSFLFRIAYTRALNHFRDTARLTGTDHLDDHPSEATPDHEAAFTLMHSHLRKAVAALPERRRAVFELCFLEGLTYREAADALEISVKTVENQMAHALKAIRRSMKVFL